MDEEQILADNAEYAKTYVDIYNHDPRPTRNLAIITCMDAWIHVPEVFKLKPGEAHVMRNAGGSASEGLRSLIVSQRLLDTHTVWVVKHTRCGMMGTTNADIRKVVHAKTGHKAEEIDFLPFAKLVQAVREDVAWLKANKYMNGIKVYGFVLKLEDGTVHPVHRLAEE